MSTYERIVKSLAGVAMGQMSEFDAAIEMQDIAREMFPGEKSPGHAMAKYLETEIGKRHANELSTVKYMKVQWDGSLGNGALDVLKRSDGASGGTEVSHNPGRAGSGRNMRTTHNEMTPRTSLGRNLDQPAMAASEEEGSYDDQDADSYETFDEEVKAYLKARQVDPDKASERDKAQAQCAVGSIRHQKERARKAGEKTKFQNMGR